MALPEFILRKLIVPGSLKSNGDGFQFILLNTFAPATITRFSIKVAGVSIPPEKIQISSEAFEKTTPAAISEINPMLTPIGVGIHFEITGHPLNGPVKLFVNTREIGEFEFVLAGSQKKEKYKKIRSSWSAFLRPALKASLTIHPNKSIGKASPFILGQFVEHLERCVYDGIWSKDGTSYRQDTLKLLEPLNIPMIRYPGGNFASGYHWEDGIGPRALRPARHDAAWQAEESNQVGTDEFLTYCEEFGIEPFIVVNDGSGTAEEAARWVEYCNGSVETEQGKRRAANGHAKPYAVKYWGVGNEVWGPWQIGTTSAREYSRRLSRFIRAMKDVDPSIKVIAVGNNPLSDDPDDPAAAWNRVVLEENGKDFDFLSWHIYQPDQADWKESYDPTLLHNAICAAPLDYEAIIHRVAAEISAAGHAGTITQSIDEWNVWLPPRPDATSMHQVTYTLRDALYVAGIINVMWRNCQQVGIATLAQLVNVLPLVKTNETTAFATTIYYPFVLAAKMGAEFLETKQDSPVFESQEISKNIKAHSSVPYLDVTATRKNDRTLSVLAINRHPENRMELVLEVAGRSIQRISQIESVQGASPLSFNDFSNPNQVGIKQHPVSNPEKLIFPPSSVNYFEIEI